MPRVVQSLSRTSSATSDESSSSVRAETESIRRTRKRFTNAQLSVLEQLFQQNSHPSREERESVARTGDMELKSVTIWFQNKRQNVKMVAAKSFQDGSSSLPSFSSLGSSATGMAHQSTTSFHTGARPFRRASTASYAFSFSSLGSRPSLDRVASMSEQRAPVQSAMTGRPLHNQHLSRHNSHLTHPLRTHHGSLTDSNGTRVKTIYDNMPSSPMGPPASPDDGAAREFVEYGKMKRTRTLEWACARRRLATMEGSLSEGDETEVEDDTTQNSHSHWTKRSDASPRKRQRHDAESEQQLPVLTGGLLQPQRRKQTEEEKLDNEDMLAAVALCRLGQGR